VRCRFMIDKTTYQVSDLGMVNSGKKKLFRLPGLQFKQSELQQLMYGVQGRRVLFYYREFTGEDYSSHLALMELNPSRKVWHESNMPEHFCELKAGGLFYFGGQGQFLSLDLVMGKKEWAQLVSNQSQAPFGDTGCEMRIKGDELQIYDPGYNDAVHLNKKTGQIIRRVKGFE
jgi:hypothetical protein